MWDVHMCPGLGSLGEAGENNPHSELSTHTASICVLNTALLWATVFSTLFPSYVLLAFQFPHFLRLACGMASGEVMDGRREVHSLGPAMEDRSLSCLGSAVGLRCPIPAPRTSFWDRTERGDGYRSCSHCLASGLCTRAWCRTLGKIAELFPHLISHQRTLRIEI